MNHYCEVVTHRSCKSPVTKHQNILLIIIKMINYHNYHRIIIINYYQLSLFYYHSLILINYYYLLILILVSQFPKCCIPERKPWGSIPIHPEKETSSPNHKASRLSPLLRIDSALSPCCFCPPSATNPAKVCLLTVDSASTGGVGAAA